MANQAPDKCPDCGSPIKKIPAGTSKTGKPYDAFWACQNRNCKYTWNKGDDIKKSSSKGSKGGSNGDVIKALRHIYSEVKKIRTAIETDKGNREAQEAQETQEAGEENVSAIPTIDEEDESARY